MNIKLFMFFLVLSLVFSFNPLAQSVGETRYMTNSWRNVNGLNAKSLSTSQSSSYTYCYVVGSSATWGIRVWKRSPTGTETEITGGTPVAQVSRVWGAGIQSATWTPPQTPLSPTDSIVVRVYINNGTWWQCPDAVFTTEQLGASVLNSETWTVYYYTRIYSGQARFYYGNGYNSRIENFNYGKGLTLVPGESSFSISPIYVPRGEINLTANLTHLNIYWEAYYSDNSGRYIGAICFLNCDKGYEVCSFAQNCSVLTPPGKSACSILNPKYNEPLNKSNNVSCTLYDPIYKELTIGNYLNSTFTPIEFSVQFSNYSSLVGEEFKLPVNIKNSGLFDDTYNLTTNITKNAVVSPETTSFLIELHGNSFDPHAWSMVGSGVAQVYIKVTILDASSGVYLCINTTSNIDPRIYKNQCISLKAQFKSLPEPELYKIFIVVLVAMVFIFKSKKFFEGP